MLWLLTVPLASIARVVPLAFSCSRHDGRRPSVLLRDLRRYDSVHWARRRSDGLSTLPRKSLRIRSLSQAFGVQSSNPQHVRALSTCAFLATCIACVQCGGHGSSRAAPTGDHAAADGGPAGEASEVAPSTGNAGVTDTGCATIGPAPQSELPHVSVSGTGATAIAEAVNAIASMQAFPVSLGDTYLLAGLACTDLDVPFSPSGYECSLQVAQDGGPPVTISTSVPSTLAQNLFGALMAAGSTTCVNPHGVHEQLLNVVVGPNSVQFDDASNYSPFPAPNVIVQGMTAQSIVAAFAAAGIDDCQYGRNAFVICNSFGGAPSCGWQWMSLETVGASELLPTCGPDSTTSPGGSLDATSSVTLWQSILAAAMAANFQPPSGNLSQTTVINASYFAWHGDMLGFTLVTGNATPPPPAH